ncbi:MAG: hypothetical protein HYR88_14075 [Verrucomicrobia bacterium]|nr:hypothetical protein [Verrucomicrobiota bacterium]MBI3867291.1 hypothetical protein [Verrucomicrobiota bacterium]
MDKIIKLPKTRRITPALDQRQRLAEEIFRAIEPQLRFCAFHTFAQFKGDSTRELWAWRYRIARNSVNDRLRKG